MEIYKNRYQATKAKTGNEVIVKVSGGYTLMDPADYRIWKNQK